MSERKKKLLKRYLSGFSHRNHAQGVRFERHARQILTTGPHRERGAVARRMRMAIIRSLNASAA